MRKTGLFLLLFCLGGCAMSAKAPRSIAYYSLDYQPPQIHIEETKPWVVQLSFFSVSPDFNSTKMIYRDQPSASQAYHYSRWRANPGEKIAALLARDFRRGKLFTAVNGPESLLPATHILEGSVEELYEDSTTSPWQARIRVSLTLVDIREQDLTRRYLFQKDFFARAGIAERGPQGLAVAMSLAMADLSRQIQTALSQIQDR